VGRGGMEPIHRIRLASGASAGPASSEDPAVVDPISDEPGAETCVDVETALGYPEYLHIFAAGQRLRPCFVEPGSLPSSIGISRSRVDFGDGVVSMTLSTAGDRRADRAGIAELSWFARLSGSGSSRRREQWIFSPTFMEYSNPRLPIL
jgi:hypothetical protein